MANEEVLGPRKTMFVLVIVVGCFAVLWPRILSPLLLGTTKDHLKPNQFDRDAGCCEVIFEPQVAVLEILNEVCNSAVNVSGKLSPYAAAECRKAVNETCGLDIAAFVKRTDNVGKTTKVLLETMKNSNSSCLKEHFGVPSFSIGIHPALNSWAQPYNDIKQERPPLRGGPHPALLERGRAIPPGVPPPSRPAPLPPHIRVRSSPLDVYFDLDIKPPPIPGMRPPMGGAGGPVQAPKSSMGFVMPIYTICIIVFFVYTLSKLLFKRTGPTPYEPVSPDPQFRRRVFRDDSRTSTDQIVVTAISGLVAEVQQQMEASYAHNQQRQEPQDNHNHARPYTNGTIIHSGPVQIVASEFRDASKERSPAPQETKSALEPKEAVPKPEPSPEPEFNQPRTETKEPGPEPREPSFVQDEPNLRPEESSLDQVEPRGELEESIEPDQSSKEFDGLPPEDKDSTPELKTSLELAGHKEPEPTPEPSDKGESPQRDPTEELIRLTEKIGEKTDTLAKLTDEFLSIEQQNRVLLTPEKQSTPELLEEALQEESPVKENGEDENQDGDQDIQGPESVKVLGMEMTAHSADGARWPTAVPPPPTPAPSAPPTHRAHEAEEVQSIYLDTQIPQQSRVLVTDFEETDSQPKAKHSPLVVSGKMTLSLIQDEPRDTPERDLESTTVDEFTTASAVTQNAAEKEDNLSEEELDEEIEVEEEEMEVSEEEVAPSDGELDVTEEDGDLSEEVVKYKVEKDQQVNNVGQGQVVEIDVEELENGEEEVENGEELEVDDEEVEIDEDDVENDEDEIEIHVEDMENDEDEEEINEEVEIYEDDQENNGEEVEIHVDEVESDEEEGATGKELEEKPQPHPKEKK